MYPLRAGDTFLAFPIIGVESSQRWGFIQKITGGAVLATMTGAASCQVEGIGRQYGASDLILPTYVISDGHPGTETAYHDMDEDYNSQVEHLSPIFLRGEFQTLRPLKAGDVVTLSPTLSGGKIKYVVIQKLTG
jgi:hypothetical protein